MIQNTHAYIFKVEIYLDIMTLRYYDTQIYRRQATRLFLSAYLSYPDLYTGICVLVKYA